jgi:glycolate oxidase subunit GlcD
MHPSAPRLHPAVTRQLAQICGRENVLSDADELLVYESDAYPLVRSRPPAVVFPTCTRQASEVIRLLAAAKIPFVPRGSGTSLAGGCLSTGGAVCISTARMRRVLDLDLVNEFAVVEAGVVTLDVSEAVRGQGYHYAPDPSSQTTCSIGGNVATGAGGPHTLKYGVTSNHVLGLTVVLPKGEIVSLGGRTRGSHGFDLVRLFVGSEGTLGLVTEVTVLLTRLPAACRTVLAVFDSMEDASRTVSAIIAAGILPAALEMMDQAILQILEAAHGYGFPRDAEAVLIIELDGIETGLDDELQRVLTICRQGGARALDHAVDVQRRALLWRARKTAFGALGRSAPCCITQDGVVPRSRLPDILQFIREVGRRHGLRIANNFHAGDGNIHPNFLFDAGDPAQLKLVLQASHEILAECVRLGGSITGEHGVGVEKTAAMKLMYSPSDLAVQQRIRRVFDPCMMANPGKIFPSLGDRCAADDNEGARGSGAHDALMAALAATGAHIERGDEAPGDAPALFRAAPASPEEAGAVIRVCSRFQALAIPCGAGGLPLDQARPVPSRAAVLITSHRLNRVVDYPASDLTITVQTGLSLVDLDQLSATNGQELAVCAPRHGTTVGGLLGINPADPCRKMNGMIADSILEAEMVLADGTKIRSGARTVKSVAGYDLHKLVVGSQGGLAFLTQVTLRLRPRPPVLRLGFFEFAELNSALHCALDLLGGRTRPGLIEVVNAGLAGRLRSDQAASGWLLVVGYAGTSEVVLWQMDEAASAVRRPMKVHSSTESREILERITDFPFLFPPELPFEIEMLRQNVGGALNYCTNNGLRAIADLGARTIRGTCPPNAAMTQLQGLRHSAGEHAVLRFPHGQPDGAAGAGLPTPAREHMQALKRELDPQGLFPVPSFLR